MAKKTESKSSTRRRLGRGLGSLMATPVQVDTGEAPPPAAPASSPAKASPSRKPASQVTPTSSSAAAGGIAPSGAETAPVDGSAITMVDPELIRANRHQPRQEFDDSSIRSLADSIREAGLMQPIVIRPNPDAGKAGALPYELIAGERRLRAVKVLRLRTVPSIIRDVSEQQSAELSLVENIQREDLNAYDRAMAFSRLISEFGMTQVQVAQRVGVNPSNVSNHIRLLELDQDAIDALRAGDITMGHARALLAVTNNKARARLLRDVIKHSLSVRALEERIRGLLDAISKAATGHTDAPARSTSVGDAHMKDLQNKLSEHLGTRVTINAGKKKGSGKLVVEFYDLDQFEGLLSRFDFRILD